MQVVPPDTPRLVTRRSSQWKTTELPNVLEGRKSGNDESDTLHGMESPRRYRSSRTFNSAVMEFSKPKLDRIELFQQCTPTFLEALYHQLENEVFEPGSEIIKQGDMGTCMYLLNFGEVEVVIGDGIVVATLRSGTLFGEMAVISKNPAAAKRSATIRAQSMCHCWRIDRPSLLRLFAVYPKDEAIISAEADRRLQDLITRGLISVPEKKHPYRHEPDIRVPSLRSLPSLKKSPTLMSIKSDAQQSDSAEVDLGHGECYRNVDILSDALSHRGEYFDCSERISNRSQSSTVVPEGEWISHVSQSSKASSPREGAERHSNPRHLLPPLESEVDPPCFDVSLLEPALPPSQPRKFRRKSWQIGETTEVKKVRNSVTAFLSRRGMMS